MSAPPMSRTDHGNTHDIFKDIQAMDVGIVNHEAWIGEVHQSLICGHAHSNLDDLRDDAHCCCKFGLWLYSHETQSLQNLDAFQLVVNAHRQMHALARKILIKSDSNTEILDSEYSDFTSQTKDFKLNVRNLQYELMSQVCVVDHLTGTWNRHIMYSKLHQEKERLMRTGLSCSICMMDIDYFKRVNDEYGHVAGDYVLKAVADFCRAGLRQYDSIYRYGGEEFLFCLPDAELGEASSIIERLCSSLGKELITLKSGETLSVTASFGISGLRAEASVEDCIQAADHALLCAKAKGRNRVCNWENVSDT